MKIKFKVPVSQSSKSHPITTPKSIPKQTNVIQPNKKIICLIGFVEGKNWILEKMADILKQYEPEDMQIIYSKKPMKGDNCLNLFWPYRCYEDTVARSVSFHTHPEKIPAWNASAKGANHIITMCDKYTKSLIKAGVPAEKITKIIPGVDEDFTFDFVLFFPCDMKRHPIRKGETLWKQISKIPGVRAICSDRTLTHAQVVSATKRADAIFISSMEEGGPMTLIEALACGTPVIAPRDVGFCDEWTDVIIQYDKGNFKSAKEAIDTLLIPKQKRAESVKEYTWKKWAEAHFAVFRKVFAEPDDK